MRSCFVGLLVFSCVPDDERSLAWAERDGEMLLVDTPEQEFYERVTLLGPPRAHLLPDGPVLPGAHAAYRRWPLRGLQPLVVADPGPWPRVLLEVEGVQLLLYVERSQLASWTIMPTWGSGPMGLRNVELEPGVEVEIIERQGERTLLRAALESFDIEVWTPSPAIDEVWRTDDRAFAQRVHEKLSTEQVLLPGVVVYEAPGGEPIAWIKQRPIAVTRTGDSEDGDVPIVVRTPAVSVMGWVHEEDLRNPIAWGEGMYGLGFRSSCRGYRFPEPMVTVPAGTILYDSEDGVVVGRVLRDVEQAVPLPGEPLLIYRYTPLGEVALWVSAEAVSAGDGL